METKRGELALSSTHCWLSTWTDDWVSDFKFSQYCRHLLKKPVKTEFHCSVMANISSSMRLLLKWQAKIIEQFSMQPLHTLHIFFFIIQFMEKALC